MASKKGKKEKGSGAAAVASATLADEELYITEVIQQLTHLHIPSLLTHWNTYSYSGPIQHWCRGTFPAYAAEQNEVHRCDIKLGGALRGDRDGAGSGDDTNQQRGADSSRFITGWRRCVLLTVTNSLTY